MVRAGEITDIKNGMMQITFCRPDACEKCGACEGGKKQTIIWAEGNGKIGDIAMVDLPEKTIVRASLIAYGLPLVLLLTGLVAGMAVTPGKDTGGLAGAGIGVLLSLLIIKTTEPFRAGRPGWKPEIKEIIPGKSEKAPSSCEQTDDSNIM